MLDKAEARHFPNTNIPLTDSSTGLYIIECSILLIIYHSNYFSYYSLKISACLIRHLPDGKCSQWNMTSPEGGGGGGGRLRKPASMYARLSLESLIH